MSKYIRSFIRNQGSIGYKLLMYLGTHLDEIYTYQREIAGQIGTPLTSLNYHITKFRGEGLMEHDSFFLTPKGQRLFRSIWNDVNLTMLRAHNLAISLNLVSCPSDYVERYSSTIFTPFSNGRSRGLKGRLSDVSLIIYSRTKAVVHLPHIYGNTLEEIIAGVQDYIRIIKEKIELDFQGIVIGDYTLSTIQTSHIAIRNSVLAQSFLLTGATYEGRNVAVDCSHGLPELEATNPRNNLELISILMRLEMAARRGP